MPFAKLGHSFNLRTTCDTVCLFEKGCQPVHARILTWIACEHMWDLGHKLQDHLNVQHCARMAAIISLMSNVTVVGNITWKLRCKITHKPDILFPQDHIAGSMAATNAPASNLSQ